MISAFNIGFPNWENDQAPIVDVDSSSIDLLHQNVESGNAVSEYFSLCVLPAESEITLDPMDDEEYHLIELDLDGSFTPANTPTTVDNRAVSTFQLKSPLRTSCCAHSLQLVIKDGFANSKNWEVLFLLQQERRLKLLVHFEYR